MTSFLYKPFFDVKYYFEKGGSKPLGFISDL